MWSKLQVRSAVGGRSGQLLPSRRFFTPSHPRLSVRQHAGKAGTGPKSSQEWSSGGVLALAAATGVLGWGAAKFRFGDGSNLLGSRVLLDEDATPRYANMIEMETVSTLTATNRHGPRRGLLETQCT